VLGSEGAEGGEGGGRGRAVKGNGDEAGCGVFGERGDGECGWVVRGADCSDDGCVGVEEIGGDETKTEACGWWRS